MPYYAFATKELGVNEYEVVVECTPITTNLTYVEIRIPNNPTQMEKFSRELVIEFDPTTGITAITNVSLKAIIKGEKHLNIFGYEIRDLHHLRLILSSCTHLAKVTILVMVECDTLLTWFLRNLTTN